MDALGALTVPRMSGLAAWPAAVPSSFGPAMAAVCVVMKQKIVIQMIRRHIMIAYPLIRFRKVSAAGPNPGAQRRMYSSA